MSKIICAFCSSRDICKPCPVHTDHCRIHCCTYWQEKGKRERVAETSRSECLDLPEETPLREEDPPHLKQERVPKIKQ